MSNGDKSEHHEGLEKVGESGECERQGEIFRGVFIPESVGVLIDLKIMDPVFIGQEKLLDVLRKQEAVIVVPFGRQTGDCSIVYVATTASMKAAIARFADNSNKCGDFCELAQYYAKRGCDCFREPPDVGACTCETADKRTKFTNVCPPIAS